MITSNCAVRFLFVGALLAGIMTGCGDIVTHSKVAKKQGMRELSEGSYAEAAGSFNNATRQNPRDYESYYYMGVAYDRLGSYQQAIRALRTSLGTMQQTLGGREDTEFRAKVLDQLAIVISKSSDRQAQIQAMEDKIKGKETAEDQYLIAKSYRYSGDADAAIDAYGRAAMLDPNDFNIAKEYGLYLVELEQLDRAEPQLKKAYKMREEDKEVADALRKIGVVPGLSLRDSRDVSRTNPRKESLPQIELAPTGGSTGAANGPRD